MFCVQFLDSEMIYCLLWLNFNPYHWLDIPTNECFILYNKLIIICPKCQNLQARKEADDERKKAEERMKAQQEALAKVGKI